MRYLYIGITGIDLSLRSSFTVNAFTYRISLYNSFIKH